MPKIALYSVNALSKEFGRDRRTIDKIVAHIEPAEIRGRTKFYRLADVEDALKSKCENAPLRDLKLTEEIRKLRLANDSKEKKLVERSRICGAIERLSNRINPMLEQKLEREYPQAISLTPEDMPRCRILGANLADAIRKEFRSFSDEWKQ
jgi:hypothetical protein